MEVAAKVVGGWGAGIIVEVRRGRVVSAGGGEEGAEGEKSRD